MSPAPRVAFLAAVLAVAALALPGALVVLVWVALAAATVADAWAVRSPPPVEREVGRVLARGAGAPLVVAVGDVGRAGRAQVRQPLPATVTADPDEADGRLDTVLRPQRRGRLVLAPPVVRLTGPLGLGRWDHRLGTEQELVVYPDLPAARALASAVRSGTARDLAVLTRGALGLGTELERVRDYLPDDDLRQVNWRATARLGKPMSNEYRLDQDRDVICLVDMGRLMGAPLAGGASRLDAALDATAAVVEVADVVGDRCGAVAFDDRVRRLVPATRRGARAVVDALFDLEPSTLDSDYRLAFTQAGGSKRACVVIFTDLVDEAAARSLVAAMPVLARRHAVVVASAVDDDLAAVLRQEPQNRYDVMTAAVAADVLAARAAAVARINQAGGVVVEARAGALGRAAVAAYLRIKARARV